MYINYEGLFIRWKFEFINVFRMFDFMSEEIYMVWKRKKMCGDLVFMLRFYWVSLVFLEWNNLVIVYYFGIWEK